MTAKARYPSQAKIAQSLAGIQRCGFRPIGVDLHPDGRITVQISDQQAEPVLADAPNPWDIALEQGTD
ncbi:hypothetical protein [Hyphomonas sp.]|uniref:hypothetical protein n=1 Tax=Hyphomonas sp. TaxID=87 RepID=UPI0025BE2E97|nr:hypothetical protein [Hyphomonas sp.]